MKKLKAFTLVELLVVIIIIGVLATLVVLSLNSSVKKAKEARAIDSIRKTQTAVAQMLVEYNDLTSSGLGAGQNGVPIQGSVLDQISINGERLLQSIPRDAKNNPIKISWNGNDYVIYAESIMTPGNCWYISNKSNNTSNATASTPCASVTLGT